MLAAEPTEALGHRTRQKFPHLNKSTKLVGLGMATTMAFWLPFVFFPLIWSSREDHRGIVWSITAASLNSCLNPFLYCWMSQRFRNSVRTAFTRIGLWPWPNNSQAVYRVSYCPSPNNQSSSRRLDAQATCQLRPECELPRPSESDQNQSPISPRLLRVEWEMGRENASFTCDN